MDAWYLHLPLRIMMVDRTRNNVFKFQEEWFGLGIWWEQRNTVVYFRDTVESPLLKIFKKSKGTSKLDQIDHAAHSHVQSSSLTWLSIFAAGHTTNSLLTCSSCLLGLPGPVLQSVCLASWCPACAVVWDYSSLFEGLWICLTSWWGSCWLISAACLSPSEEHWHVVGLSMWGF